MFTSQTTVRDAYQELQGQRDLIQARLKTLRASYMDTSDVDELASRIDDISQLESHLARIEKLLGDENEHRRQIALTEARSDLEKGTQVLDRAEKQEALLSKDIDRLFAELEQKARELIKLHHEVKERISPEIGSLPSSETQAFYARRNKFGKVGWIVKRLFYQYEKARGRFPNGGSIPEW